MSGTPTRVTGSVGLMPYRSARRNRVVRSARVRDNGRATVASPGRRVPFQAGPQALSSLRTSRAFYAGPHAPFTPYFPRLPLRTSCAVHSELPAPFTPYFPCPLLRTSCACPLRTSRAFHSVLPVPSTPHLMRCSLRTSRAFHSVPHALFTPNFPRFHSGLRVSGPYFATLKFSVFFSPSAIVILNEEAATCSRNPGS